MDRRIQKTRNSLVQALPGLMLKYDWDTINVQLLCDHANVSRSAFYTHFKSKTEVLDQCFERLEQELHEPVSARGLDTHGTLLFIPNLLSHVESHCELLERNAASAAGLVILNRFKFLVKKLASREFEQSNQYQPQKDQLTFITGGIFAMLEQWSEENCQSSVQALTKRVDSLVNTCLV